MKFFKLKFVFIGLLVFIGTYWTLEIVRADPNCDNTSGLSPDEMQFCIDKISRDIGALSPAQEKNKQDLSALNRQISDITAKIANFTKQLGRVEIEIEKRDANLSFTQKIFEEKAKNHYTFIRLYDPITPFLFSDNAVDAFREISFRQKTVESDKNTIGNYVNDLVSLKKDKENLEKNKTNLSNLSAQVSEKQKFLASEVAKVDSYISSLTAKQNSLVAAKSAGFSTTVGDVPQSAEPCAGKSGSSNFCDPGFRPAFGGFSYGAPHRKGMSQYGAYGRAKSGQGVEEILRAYYGGVELNKSYPSKNITVTGYGTVDLETYVKRIYEMPSSWTDNDSAALKAQAVAARSYALAYTNNGTKPICATESCQVYKPANKGGAWDSAVEATRGWVLVSGGQPFSAWYASTSGGYTFGYSAQGFNTPNLWDTPNGQGGWPNNAYEIKGGSPWFYKGWYKDRSGKACGRTNPWLKESEMADILNAWKVITQGGGDASRVSPLDTSCWSGSPYSISELQSIGGFNSVSGVSVIYGTNGSTQSVTFSTNKGSVTISGEEFKKAFNLRAPGYIGIKSSLFNIEKL